MNTPHIAATRVSFRKILLWLGWALVLGTAAYFLVKNTPRYLVLNAASYGKYFWAKAGWLFPHVVAGMFAVVIGPLQFWPKMRRDYLSFHRLAGRIYVTAVAVGSIAAFGMAATINGKPAFALGLTALGGAWLVTTGMAFIAIRRKNIVQHRQWMVRSYVVTFAFITYRLANDLMTAAGLYAYADRQAMLAWGCWAIPLLATEVFLQAKAVFAQRPLPTVELGSNVATIKTLTSQPVESAERRV
jgi:uncharacterized membrane protein